MAQIVYTKAQLVERIQKHLNNGFPGSDWKISTNEMLLYIDTNIPFILKGQMFDNAKVTGVIDVPEAFLVTYNYTISSQDNNTKEWYITLAQPPLALPTGYDITQVYLANPADGKSQNAYPIKVKRVPYRDYMPKPNGFFYRVSNGQKLYLKTSDGSSLYGYSLFVEQPVSRTDDINAAMTLPDDAIEMLFNKTVATILQRYNIPQDIVQDNLPAGNKTS
jgi:hypothetical protein